MFDAARDLVFTNSADGKTIMSGGYRIKKIFGTAKNKHGGGSGKRKNKKEYHEEVENLYKENYGIPMGLLFLSPKFSVEQQQQEQEQKVSAYTHAHENDDAAAAAVAAIGELELVMSPQQSQLIISDPDHNNNNCVFKEDATEIISNEVDPEVFQILLNNTVTDHNHNHTNHANFSKRVTKKRNANDDDLKSVKLYKKIYMRRKTRKHNNN